MDSVKQHLQKKTRRRLLRQQQRVLNDMRCGADPGECLKRLDRITERLQEIEYSTEELQI